MRCHGPTRGMLPASRLDPELPFPAQMRVRAAGRGLSPSVPAGVVGRALVPQMEELEGQSPGVCLSNKGGKLGW